MLSKGTWTYIYTGNYPGCTGVRYSLIEYYKITNNEIELFNGYDHIPPILLPEDDDKDQISLELINILQNADY
jgi:hypothetical protein